VPVIYWITAYSCNRKAFWRDWIKLGCVCVNFLRESLPTNVKPCVGVKYLHMRHSIFLHQTFSSVWSKFEKLLKISITCFFFFYISVSHIFISNIHFYSVIIVWMKHYNFVRCSNTNILFLRLQWLKYCQSQVEIHVSILNISR